MGRVPCSLYRRTDPVAEGAAALQAAHWTRNPSTEEDSMRAGKTTALTGALLLTVFTMVPGHAQEHDHDHRGGDASGAMMGAMMEECPMMGGQMRGQMGGMMGPMGPQALLERADELDLTDEQVAALEDLAEEHEEMRQRMMEAMEGVSDVLTPEQMEKLHEGMRMRGSMGAMHGPGHMRGDEAGPRGGMMGAGAAHCPMMGGPPDGHDHPREGAHP